jgi:hypothetical protein
MWKKTTVVCVKALFQHLSCKTMGLTKNFNEDIRFWDLALNPGPPIQSRHFNHSTTITNNPLKQIVMLSVKHQLKLRNIA